jgi:hypothetical protein
LFKIVLPTQNIPGAVCGRACGVSSGYGLQIIGRGGEVARSIYATLGSDKEHFVLLAMNNKNRVNGFKVISTGTLTPSLAHPREVWRAALHLCAACGGACAQSSERRPGTQCRRPRHYATA